MRKIDDQIILVTGATDGLGRAVAIDLAKRGATVLVHGRSSFDDVMIRKNYSPYRAYCQSKLAQISMTIDLAEDLKSKNVMVTALHPSTYMPTKMVTAAPLSTIEQGVRATVQLAIDPELDHVTGKFFDVLSETKADAQAYDSKAREKLRALSETLIAL